MNQAPQVIHALLHGARTLFAELPSTFHHTSRSVPAGDQKRRLAYTLLARNPGVAADLFAAADRQEQCDGH